MVLQHQISGLQGSTLVLASGGVDSSTFLWLSVQQELEPVALFVNFWRVEEAEPGGLVRLRSEIKLPGEAWLQFEMREREDGVTWLEQTAVFAPRGLMGLLYWYALYPVHAWIFGGMTKSIARRAEKGG